jgi:glucose/arabinose dehydrogenase
MNNSREAGLILSTIFLATTLLAPISVYGQEESENPPTLKLDRIPSMPAFVGQTRAPAAGPSDFKIEVLAADLSKPWALAFLPDGEILINELTGQMRILNNSGQLSRPLAGLPEISQVGWAGLFDVALDPDFASNQWVYFSYSGMPETPDGKNIPQVARGRLDRDELRITDVEILISGIGKQELDFAPDKTLLVSGAGEESDTAAQDLNNTYGKLLRINRDGSVPHDNPWVSDPEVPSEIFSIGHRDVSGMATHPETGQIWMTEHGPRGGDEINIVKAGANYGWMVISYGTEYSGEPIAAGATAQAGMEQPRYFWRPSIAPSGLIFYSGEMFPEWQGNIFVTSLAGQHISRLVLDGDHVVAEERMLVERASRVREIRQGPDGALYLLTNAESDGTGGKAELLRIFKN